MKARTKAAYLMAHTCTVLGLVAWVWTLTRLCNAPTIREVEGLALLSGVLFVLGHLITERLWKTAAREIRRQQYES